MKKNNPNTGRPYRRGDLSPCKMKRFWSYKTSHKNKDGFFSISWKDAQLFNQERERFNTKGRKQNSANKLEKLPKRCNPKTGKPFMMGERREDGHFFAAYSANGRVKGGFMGENWLSPDAYLKYRIGLTFGKIKKRAAEKQLPLNIDPDYLYDIYPKDGLCPILAVEMQFGGDRNDSPSVDRIMPELGYVKGNVHWVSKIANSAKKDFTASELRILADWIERQPVWKQTQKT